jgi:uncharacterized protein with FMN-binding domain
MKSILAFALIIGSGGAVIVKTQTHVTEIRNEQVTSAAYRDGAYLGRLAAENGKPAHVSIARWSTAANRELFLAGYEKSYAEQTAKNRLPDQEDSAGVVNRATNAAFRDGLYVGKLDAARGNAIHVAVGRWSTKEGRSAFAEGYGQTPGGSDQARTAEDRQFQALITR